jgi:hypothetical protein
MNRRFRELFRVWNRYMPTAGMISFASFLVAVVSGVVLAIPYDIAHPMESIQVMLLSNRPGALFRSIHYWSAQVFLVTVIFHVFEYMLASKEKDLPRGKWYRLAISIPAAMVVMLTGFILKGDGESFLAMRIFHGLVASLPIAGDTLSFFILGSDTSLQVIYIHHVATTTIFLWLVIAEHGKKIWPTALSMAYGMAGALILSVVFPIFIHNNADPVKKGPWYFIGLQEILHYFSHPVWLMYGLIALLILFMAYTRFPEKLFSFTRKTFLFLFIVYMVMFIIGWFFRGAGWQFHLPWEATWPGERF